MDTIDQAQKLEQLQRDKAIAAAKTRKDDVGTKQCIECDCLIPSARRKVNPNAMRCIVCQSDHEAYEAKQ